MTDSELRISLKESISQILTQVNEIRGMGSKEKVKEGDTEIETEGVLDNLLKEYKFQKAMLDNLDVKKTKPRRRLNRRTPSDYGV